MGEKILSKRTSLAQRLAIALIIAVTAVTFIAGSWFYFHAMMQARDQMDAKIGNAIDYLESVLPIPLWNYDHKVIVTISRTLMEDNSYTELVVKDHNGSVIFSDKRHVNGKILTKEITVRYNDEIVGTVNLSLSARSFSNAPGK